MTGRSRELSPDTNGSRVSGMRTSLDAHPSCGGRRSLPRTHRGRANKRLAAETGRGQAWRLPATGGRQPSCSVHPARRGAPKGEADASTVPELSATRAPTGVTTDIIKTHANAERGVEYASADPPRRKP